MERILYQIYRITAPDGRCYVGCTSQTLNERWRQHRLRARDGKHDGHPFYHLINEIGEDKFTVELIEMTSDKKESQELEIKHIAEVPEEKRLNLSRGGYYDSTDAGLIFWEHLSEDEKAAFREKLSEIKKANDWTDYDALHRGLAEWRKVHPKEAYLNGRRAIRIANRTCPTKQEDHESKAETPEERRRRLRWRYKQREVRAENAAANWAGYSSEKRAAIAAKISETRKRRNAELSQEERNQMVAEARKHIDRSKQGIAASQGIKRFWEELRKDPERYHEYISRRSATCSRTMKEKYHANV